MRGLASVVGNESDSGGEGAELSFGGEVKGWETPRWGKYLSEMVAS